MNKNFSLNNNKNRDKLDFYQTPYCVIYEFIKDYFKNKELPKVIADLTCGKFSIENTLKEFNITTISKDIIYNQDIFLENNKYDYILMNPPFKLFNQIVKKCIEICNKEFYLVAPTSYLQGINRFNKNFTGVFQVENFKLKYIYTFNRYILFEKELRQDKKINTGMMSISIYVFQKGYNENYQIHKSLDINDYVYKITKK